WVRVAAALLVGASIVWVVAEHVRTGKMDDAMSRELVSAHVRSTMADHLVDVPSSDRHQVRPWFGGKLDYSPEVRELAGDGFPLAGGGWIMGAGGGWGRLVYTMVGTVSIAFWGRAG